MNDGLEVLARLADYAEGQWGQVTLAQAHDLGAGPALLDRWRAHRLVEPVTDDVLRLRAGGRAEWPRLYATWLALRPRIPGWQRDLPSSGVVSHGAALRVFGAGDFAGPPAEFTVATPADVPPARDGVTIHVAPLGPGDWQLRAGLPVTRPERTLADLAATARLDVPELGRAAADLLRHTDVTVADLAAALEFQRPGTSGARWIDQLLAAADAG